MGENDAANNGSLDGVGDNIMVTVGTTRRVSAPSMDGFAKKPQSAFASVAVEGEPVAKPPGSQEEGPPRQYSHCGLSRFIRPQLGMLEISKYCLYSIKMEVPETPTQKVIFMGLRLVHFKLMTLPPYLTTRRYLGKPNRQVPQGAAGILDFLC
jgi:hypothetical protein